MRESAYLKLRLCPGCRLLASRDLRPLQAGLSLIFALVFLSGTFPLNDALLRPGVGSFAGGLCRLPLAEVVGPNPISLPMVLAETKPRELVFHMGAELVAQTRSCDPERSQGFI